MDHNHDASDRIVAGCPACNDWQVDIDSFDPELPVLLDAAVAEHVDDVHPGQQIDDVSITSVGDLGGT